MAEPRFETLVDMQEQSVARFGPHRFLGTKRNGIWTWTTYALFGERVDAVRSGLAASGVSKGDSVGLISANREEWAVVAYATYGLGARLVPMYEHQLAEEWRYIIEDSVTKVLLVSTEVIHDQVKNWPKGLDHLRAVFSMAAPAEADHSYAALEVRGKEQPIPTAEIDVDDVCGFIYTSGTTGRPKGVLLTHRNFVSNVNPLSTFLPIGPDDCAVSFLPWAHSLGHTVELHTLMSMGAHIAFAESVEKLVDNIGEVRPTLLVSVPRIWNKIYDGLNKKMDEAGGLKKALFKAGMANAAKRRRLASQGQESSWVQLKHRFFDRLVFSKVRDRFGGRLRYAFSGGAALSIDVGEFIDSIGIPVYEGYGLTETSPVVACNRPGAHQLGTVGKVLPGVRVEIDTSVLEDAGQEGELVVYGDLVMKGYHELPDETAAVMTEDGGFRTGDRGYVDADGFVRITGRIKEQYKLENGKYVVPAPLEEQLQLSPFITQVFVEGANQPFNVALVVPDRDAVEQWAKKNGVNASYASLLENERVRELIGEELKRLGSVFKAYERVKEFRLIPEEFSTQNGLLTPSLKVKRRKVLQEYENLLAPMWGDQ